MTSIPTVKAALVAALTAALPDVTVIYGPRSEETVTRPQVLTVGGVLGRREPADMASSSFVEDYDLSLSIAVGLPGADSMQMAEEQALDIFDATAVVVEALAAANADVTLSGEFELSEIAGAAGRAVVVTFPVHVYAANA